MTTSLSCRFALACPDLAASLPAADLSTFVREHFLNGSHGDISLTCVDPVSVPDPVAAGTAVSALQLHRWLLQINQNPDDQTIQNICVIFAPSYAGLSGAFGLMFDRGFTTIDDGNSDPIYLSQPRQGCAVFLDTIRSQRSAEEFSSEVLFTTVHELGHVFNLQHDESSLNFMHTSGNAAFDASAYIFTPDEQSRLEVCSTDSNVMPGGSKFASDGAYNQDARKRPRRSQSLRLRIDIEPKRFFRFEPVQLGLELSLPDGLRETRTVAEALDPSRARFRIMTENDLGERRLYRPVHFTCGPVGPIDIGPGKPYRRDLPLFAQSGGYTFGRAGRHRVWVEWMHDGGLVVSNTVEVYVEREVGLSAGEREHCALLREPEIASLLFHREDISRGGVATRRLARYLERNPDRSVGGELYYSLARSILRHRAKDAASLLKLREQAHTLLERALSCAKPGTHRHARTEQWLAECERDIAGAKG